MSIEVGKLLSNDTPILEREFTKPLDTLSTKVSEQ